MRTVLNQWGYKWVGKQPSLFCNLIETNLRHVLFSLNVQVVFTLITYLITYFLTYSVLGSLPFLILFCIFLLVSPPPPTTTESICPQILGMELILGKSSLKQYFYVLFKEDLYFGFLSTLTSLTSSNQNFYWCILFLFSVFFLGLSLSFFGGWRVMIILKTVNVIHCSSLFFLECFFQKHFQ